MNISLKKYTYTRNLLLVCGVLLMIITLKVYAWSTTGITSLAGYAWSDTIGWISMSCETGGPTGNNICATSNYKVSASPITGVLSGYAWSDNIGWVSFNAGDTAGCPSTPCGATLTATGMDGFAKAVAGGSAQSGGWDGYIDLGTVTRSSDTAFGGYAWGGGGTNASSSVIGWVSMSGVTAESSPECSDGVDNDGTGGTDYPADINCASALDTSENDIPLVSAGSDRSITLPVTTASASGASASDPGGSIASTVWSQFSGGFATITGGNSLTPSFTGMSSAGVYVFRLTVTDNTGLTNTDDMTVSVYPVPNVPPNLTASARIVEEGSTVTLSWELFGQTGCTLVGGTTNMTELGTDSSVPIEINALTVFTLTCGAESDQVTVEIPPRGFET